MFVGHMYVKPTMVMPGARFGTDLSKLSTASHSRTLEKRIMGLLITLNVTTAIDSKRCTGYFNRQFVE